MLTLLPKGALTKWLKFFCLKIFSICHRCRWHRWCTLSREYLREFSKKFELAVKVYSDAWGKLIHEKNQKSKISWHCPFNSIFCYADLIFSSVNSAMFCRCIFCRWIEVVNSCLPEGPNMSLTEATWCFPPPLSSPHVLGGGDYSTGCSIFLEDGWVFARMNVWFQLTQPGPVYWIQSVLCHIFVHMYICTYFCFLIP